MTRKQKPAIFISDLHIDRWDRDRKESFFGFLDYVEKEASQLFVLGDIFDFPALKGESIWPRHSEIISRLRSLPDKGVPLSYIIGNHDISLRGIEIAEQNFVLTYCDNKQPFERALFGKNVYLEHGHYYDPLFQDHIYDAVEFLRSVTGQAVDQRATDFLRDVIRIFQRNPKHKTEQPVGKEEVGVPERFLKIWEQAAEQLIKRKRYDIVFFGHTHGPTIVEMLGGSQWYVNTGDWVAHSTYTLLTENKIQSKEWLDDSVLKEVEITAAP